MSPNPKPKKKTVYRNVVKCPDCSSPMTWDKATKKYQCKCGKLYRLVEV